MKLNDLLNKKKENLINFMITNQPIPFRENDILVFDIEACAINNHTEMLTYSIACMSCYDNTDTMYWYNDVEYFLDMLLNANCKNIKIYAHNCLYDIKPFIIKFVEKYGNNQKKLKFEKTLVYNSYSNKYEKLNLPKINLSKKMKKHEYELLISNNIFYGLTIQGEKTTIKFLDSYKILPNSLKEACKSFLNLELSKEGLDYNKQRTLEEKLTKEELSYIYDDVFGLKYLIKLCCIDGFDVNGKHVKFTKLTNSSQSLYDYKQTLLEDFEKKQNAFANKEFCEYVEKWLLKSGFYNEKADYKKVECLFTAIFGQPQYTTDKWIRKSYYGGLCTPHYENCKKYSKLDDHRGKVYDVNSLYPFIMKTCLLPYGKGEYKDIPYKKTTESYKEKYPLYIQDITIYDLEVKKGHMAWLQVKGNGYFNNREILKNNVKNGELIELNLRLCKPLFELLFECYNVKSYKLGGHFAYRGTYNLFDNYIDFWKEVKQTSKGAKRATAKLRQNGLYGKFGMNSEKKESFFNNDEGKFSIEYGETYLGSSVYLPMATFITSYAKQYLVNAINNNYDRFMYCDTDSLHLYGIEDPKGMKIDDKEYGAWDNEDTFIEYKYLSPKRYAELCEQPKEKIDKKTNKYIYKLDNITFYKWTIKCCGLTDEIMKKVDDIEVFDYCEFDSKTIRKMFDEGKILKSNSKDDVYYYKDPQHKIKVKGLIKSKKSKIVKYGTDIHEQPYMITKANNYLY